MEKNIDIAYTSKEVSKTYNVERRKFDKLEGVRIITNNRDIYLLSLKHVKKNYRQYVSKHKGGYYELYTIQGQ